MQVLAALVKFWPIIQPILLKLMGDPAFAEKLRAALEKTNSTKGDTSGEEALIRGSE